MTDEERDKLLTTLHSEVREVKILVAEILITLAS